MMPVLRNRAAGVSAYAVGWCLAAGAIAAAGQVVSSVDDGVYTTVQATRGTAAYDAACGRCHRADLGGADGPALKDAKFAKDFAGRDLGVLYAKIARSMPRGAPGSLADGVYLDIVAHILEENGFPPGAAELTADRLHEIQVEPGRPKPLPPVGDFSYVEVTGCLTAGPGGAWSLTSAGEPVATVAPGSPDLRTVEAPASTPIGDRTYALPDAFAYAPGRLSGQRVRVRGLLVRTHESQRLTISAIDAVAPACTR